MVLDSPVQVVTIQNQLNKMTVEATSVELVTGQVVQAIAVVEQLLCKVGYRGW